MLTTKSNVNVKVGRNRRTVDRGLVLRFTKADPLRLVGLVRAGFPYGRLEAFRKAADLSMEEVAKMIQIPPRTLARRQTLRRLRPDESDRLLRAATIFQKTTDLFEGDISAARRWLKTPQQDLGGYTPFEFASTEVGAREVENLILRLEHGVFS